MSFCSVSDASRLQVTNIKRNSSWSFLNNSKLKSPTRSQSAQNIGKDTVCCVSDVTFSWDGPSFYPTSCSTDSRVYQFSCSTDEATAAVNHVGTERCSCGSLLPLKRMKLPSHGCSAWGIAAKPKTPCSQLTLTHLTVLSNNSDQFEIWISVCL